jgi:hypothetical protein
VERWLAVLRSGDPRRHAWRDVVQIREVIETRGLDPEELLDALSSTPAPVAATHSLLGELKVAPASIEDRSF